MRNVKTINLSASHDKCLAGQDALEKAVRSLEAMVPSDGDGRAVTEMKQALDAYIDGVETVHVRIVAGEIGSLGEADTAVKSYDDSGRRLISVTRALAETSAARRMAAVHTLAAATGRMNVDVAVVGVVAIGLLALQMVRLARSITRPLRSRQDKGRHQRDGQSAARRPGAGLHGRRADIDRVITDRRRESAGGRGGVRAGERSGRDLQRPRGAARNTEGLIKQSVSLAEEGERNSAEVNANLREIVSAVTKVTDIVGEIAVASGEQARRIEQVDRAVASSRGTNRCSGETRRPYPQITLLISKTFLRLTMTRIL